MRATDTDLATVAAQAAPVQKVIGLVRWVGDGRKLTQTGRLTLGQARELIALLDTGDVIDPMIGDTVFRTKSSEDLGGLTLVVTWAKAAGLLRVTGGKLVPVKKYAALPERPVALWARMFEVFGKIGEGVCPPGWGESIMREGFGAAMAAIFTGIDARGGTITLDEAYDLAWRTLSVRYRISELTDGQRETWRKMCDRDVRFAVAALLELGAVTQVKGTVRMTPLALSAQRGSLDVDAAPAGRATAGKATAKAVAAKTTPSGKAAGEVAQLKITLLELEPAVWRRVLVPADIRLSRLHDVLQAAMGWQDGHLHVFTHESGEYGPSDPELDYRDEGKTALSSLLAKAGEVMGYTYDFGDGWEHEIELEQMVPADARGRYPICTGGARACPPEDCGGVYGYVELLESLADPDSPDYEDMLEWLDLEKGSDFDPDEFSIDDANLRLAATRRLHSRRSSGS